MPEEQIPEGPITWPLPPPNEAAMRAVREKLRGHATAANWLPEGLWPELDELRHEHLRVRHQVAGEVAALKALEDRFREEDRCYERGLQQAQREDRLEAVEDRRTPSEKRRADQATIAERLWAGVIVLGETKDAVIELFREREDDWLADLRAQLEPAREKRREAERLLEEAKAEEWHLHQLGQWVQITADDGAFGAQPAPTPSPPPARFSAEVAASMLERPWHKRREAEELPRSWQQQSQDAADRLEEAALRDGDPTGQVSELDETAGGAAA